MGRSRVLSFISAFGAPRDGESGRSSKRSSTNVTPAESPTPDTPSPPPEMSPVSNSLPREKGKGSRPASMTFSRNPPLMQVAEDTPPELSPIFSFLNIHTNKVYHEGYFLKLNDQDSNGRPCVDRQWTECYAQLVGTVLSLWDAAALDAAGGEEVPATFVNLADASIKMIETLPIRNGSVPPLKNVLSLSSAGKNRYLLHFSTFNSMTQWTAAIRLAMYEHTALYEAYTGSLIAAKGKNLPGIQSILMPSKFKHEDWARVRFGAGTPWTRCWFVINPPDEKEMQKARKATKKSAYDRLSIPVTGNIQFFETKKTKKAQPIATVTQVYSAYAIYPQSKALIDASTLVKLEGHIQMHGQSQTSSEGFVYIMPELHAAVSGFETMLRFLFPTFDTFNLYGRPTRLVADTNHIKSIMFAFPKERRYGYLDVLDIAALLQTPGSQQWTEAQWRKQLKEATQKRLSTGRSRTNSVNSARPRYRNSFSMRHSDVPMDPARRSFVPPAGKAEFNQSAEAVVPGSPKRDPPIHHSRGMSDTTDWQTPYRPNYSSVSESSPDSSAQDLVQRGRLLGVVAPIAERKSSEIDSAPAGPVQSRVDELPRPPSPVTSPPTFVHGPRAMPTKRPQTNQEQRLANNRMSHATLSQLTSVGKMGTAGSVVTFPDDQPSDSSIDRGAQSHRPRNAPAAPGPKSQALGHSSSDEGLGIAMPVRTPQPREQRPPTPSTGTPSPQELLQSDSDKAIKRKPLPQRPLFMEAPHSPDGGEPSYDDLRHTMDEDALNRVGGAQLPSPVSPTKNGEGSVYDDAASTTSPDYASTHESAYSQQSQISNPRPRMGVMKTVGMQTRQDLVIGDARYSTDKAAESRADIPSVNFGPTLAYTPTTGRPSTAETMKPPRFGTDPTGKYKLSVPTNPIPRGRSQEELRRSVMWQPGMAANRPVTPGGGLTPEQYVQERAAPNPPMHMHPRSPSNNTLPPQRPGSGDWAQQARAGPRVNNHQDNTNYRPSSRGAGPMFTNYSEGSNRLSAREQEHIARATGSSFFNMNEDNRRPHVNTGGLVSAIDAREREKRQMKEGMSNQMVQQAIAQRQQRLIHQQQLGPQYAGSQYPPQPPQHPMYHLPAASHTWDALHQMNRSDEPRRRSWYGQLPQAAQGSPYPPSQPYAQNQPYPPQGGYQTHYNTAQRY